VQLAERTWVELSTGEPPLLCVPIGSCEQHGPHLPLGTDTMVAEELAAGLAGHRSGIVVAPSLAVTASGEHAGFAGRTETSLVLAMDSQLVRTARAEAGGTAPLTELAPRLRAQGVRAVSPNGVLGDPTDATESEGRELLDTLLDQLVAAVDAWRHDRAPR
jgi:creatinine amidohydrolase/Fe(II)-dependent formamide hydrolase-like protein